MLIKGQISYAISIGMEPNKISLVWYSLEWTIRVKMTPTIFLWLKQILILYFVLVAFYIFLLKSV